MSITPLPPWLDEPAPHDERGAGPLARDAFAHQRPFTVGVEEELQILDPRTLDLAPLAPRLLALSDGDPRVHGELPLAQVELVSPPCADSDALRAQLIGARADLRRRAGGLARFAGAGTHAFAAVEGVIDEHGRYANLAREYGWAARRALVFGLHVHVAVDGADRALAVWNALRGYLPHLAVVAGNAPIHAGADTGLASIRPKLCEVLPRQGVPPAFATWEDLEAWVGWAVRAGSITGPAQLWWETRLHPRHGTIEVRVCDQPATVREAVALATVVQALVRWLADRHDAGEALPAHARERIEENRWRAARHGARAVLLDLDTGEGIPARRAICALMDTISPWAVGAGAERALDDAVGLLARTGAERQRARMERGGPVAVVADLADRFDAELAGR